jgi:hypothetical protein
MEQLGGFHVLTFKTLADIRHFVFFALRFLYWPIVSVCLPKLLTFLLLSSIFVLTACAGQFLEGPTFLSTNLTFPTVYPSSSHV